MWGGQVGPGRLLIGGNVQGRYNPKKKLSQVFENDDGVPQFDGREDQNDTRNGTDYSFNGSYGVDFGRTRFELNGFYVRTDRTERERARAYDHQTATAGPVPGGNLLSDASQLEDIDQENYSIDAKLRQKWSLGETTFRIGYAAFKEDIKDTEREIDFDRDEDPPEFGGERTLQDIRDRELSLGLDHALPLGGGIKLVVGGYFQNKDRDTDITAAEDEFELTDDLRDSYDPFADSPDDFPASFVEFEPVPGGLNKIKEQRRDAFALVEGKTGFASWEAGVRYEHTDVRIRDHESGERFTNSYGMLLPSVATKLDITNKDRINIAVARTNRRPQFDYLSPALLEAELGDNDLLGNPDLKPERAWGIDVGYERRIGRTGVAGVNFFYRKVTDLVELANTGEEGSEGEGTFVLQPRNTSDGKAWGVEFDLSTSLGLVGMPDTGVFGNLALLDSEVRDFLGKRRFNGQPKFVYNFGFIQNLRTLGAAFGVTYRKQGAARDRIVGEEVRTTYGADLEAFVEKRFGERLTVRAVGSNLLNGAKREVFNTFSTIEDQVNRDFDEFEIEREKAGRVFQLVARLAL